MRKMDSTPTTIDIIINTSGDGKQLASPLGK